MLRPWNLQIKTDPDSKIPIYMQIVNAIIHGIKSGVLQKDTVLPGSRNLAELLNLNRNTIVKALNILTAEGWLVSIERKGIFVAGNIPEMHTNTSVSEIPKYTRKKIIQADIIFDDGIPDTNIAPMESLSRAYRRVFNQKARRRLMNYSNALGSVEFREAIAQMLYFKRGLCIDVDHICITRGSQMAMYLIAQILFTKGDVVIVENPGYLSAWKAFETSEVTVIPVEIDREGLLVDHIELILKKNTKIKAVFVTPHHQYPTTVTMSLTRRLKLIELSNMYGFTIIEDDYDHEFHFGQRPVLPISSHKEIQNYLYIGSMSKVVAPALRIGYLVGSPDFIHKIGSLRETIDVQGDIIMELAVLDLIHSGEIRKHLKRATAYYKEKREAFTYLLEKHLSGKITYTIPEGGLAFWIQSNDVIDYENVYTSLLQKRIEIIHPNKFSHQKEVQGLRLGYASLSSEDLKKGLIEIGKLL
nr:PLP-dependent aminotransferase family protein [Aquimarina sp. I32.4]